MGWCGRESSSSPPKRTPIQNSECYFSFIYSISLFLLCVFLFHPRQMRTKKLFYTTAKTVQGHTKNNPISHFRLCSSFLPRRSIHLSQIECYIIVNFNKLPSVGAVTEVWPISASTECIFRNPQYPNRNRPSSSSAANDLSTTVAEDATPQHVPEDVQWCSTIKWTDKYRVLGVFGVFIRNCYMELEKLFC